ncbi:MAG: hypothetical protein WCT26_00440 [Candidatus Buchananbacteria bacterium]|jgi:hypothetical protein
MKKTRLIVLIAATIVIIGAGVYLWQYQKISTETRKDLSEGQNVNSPIIKMIIPQEVKIYSPQEVNELKKELIGKEIFVKGSLVQNEVVCTQSIPGSCSSGLALKEIKKDILSKVASEAVILRGDEVNNMYKGKKVECNNSGSCYPMTIDTTDKLQMGNIYIVKGVWKEKIYSGINYVEYYLEIGDFEKAE